MAKDCVDLQDIKDNLKIKLAQKYVRSADKDSGKKPFKFDTHAITGNMYFDLFSGTKDKDDAPIMKRIKDAVKNNNVFKRLAGADSVWENKNLLFDDLLKDIDSKDMVEKNKIGNRMMVRGLVMRHIIGAIKSEADIQKKKGLSDKDANQLFNNGSRNISLVGTATALGREIAFATGFKISNADPAYTNKIYNKIGMAAIKEVAKNTDLLVLDSDAKILNNDYMSSPTKNKSSSSLIDGFDVVRLNLDKFVSESDAKAPKNLDTKDKQIEHISKLLDEGKPLDLISRSEEWLAPIGTVAATQKYVGRLAVPSNEMIPGHEASEKAEIKIDSRTTPMMKKTLKRMQEKKTGVSPTLAKFFLQLNKMVKEASEKDIGGRTSADFESIVSSIFGKDSHKKGTTQYLNAIFGTMDKQNIADDQQRTVGQALSKTNTLQVMVEMADQFFNEDGTPKDLFFTHEMYRNGRVGFMETALNGQSDKFFSRYALSGGSVKIKVGSPEFNHLLNAIRDDGGKGLTNADILGTSNNEGLETMLAEYEKAFVDTEGLSEDAIFKKQAEFMKTLVDGGVKAKDGRKMTKRKYMPLSGSVWQKISTLQGIHEVRNQKDGVIETSFQSKPDATGSGIILQLLQIFGLDVTGDAEEKLGKLGLLEGVDGEQGFNDVYSFLENAIKNDNTETGADAEANQIINNMIDLKFFNSMRDIVKPTTMITSYLAGKETIINESADAYADKIIETLLNDESDVNVDGMTRQSFVMDLLKEHNKKFFDKYLDGNKFSNDELANIPGIKDAISESLKGTAGEYSERLVKKALTSGSMNNFQTKIKKIYDDMQNLLTQNQKLLAEGKVKDPMELRILPARVVLDIMENPNDPAFKGKSHKELLKEFGLPIMSSKQLLVDNDTVVQKESVNALTALVNVVHAMDSAIMFRAHENTMNRIEAAIKALESKKNRTTDDDFRLEQLREANEMMSVSIHDANNGNVVYNTIYEEEYKNQVEYVSQNYDMFSEMVKSLEVYNDWEGATAGPGKETLTQLKKEAAESAKKRKNIKLNKEGGKIFGYDNESQAETDVLGNEVTDETKNKTKALNDAQKKIDEARKKGEDLDPVDDEKAYLENEIEVAQATLEYNQLLEPQTEAAKKAIDKKIERAQKIINDATNELNELNDKKEKTPGEKVKERLKKKIEENKKKESKEDTSNPFEFGENVDVKSYVNHLIDPDGKLEVKSNKDMKVIEDFFKELDKADKERDSRLSTEESKKEFLKEFAERMDKAAIYWYNNSEMIRRFLDRAIGRGAKLSGLFKNSNQFAYGSMDDKIHVPNIKDLSTPMGVWAVEHELTHRYANSFMGSNPDDKNVKIIKEAVKNIDKYKDALLEAASDNDFIKSRLEYLLTRKDEAQLAAEMTAILGSEKQVQKKFLESMRKINEERYGNKMVLAAKNIMTKVKKFMSIDSKIDPDELISAIETVVGVGEYLSETNPKEAERGRKEWLKERMLKDNMIDENGHLVSRDGISTGYTFDQYYSAVNNAGIDYLIDNQANDGEWSKRAREKFDEDMTYKKYEPINDKETGNPLDSLAVLANYLNSTTANIMHIKEAESGIKKGVVYADKFMSQKFPVYAQYRNQIADYWDSSAIVAEFKGYLSPSRFGDTVTMQRIMAAHQEAVSARGTMDSTFIEGMNKLMEGLDEKQVESLYGVTSQAPMFHLMNSDQEYQKLVNGETTVDELISKYEAKFNGKEKRRIKRLADLLTGENYDANPNDSYNINSLISGKEAQENARRLTALYSIKNIEGYEDTLNILKERPDLSDRIVDAAVGLREAHNSLFSDGREAKRYRENLIDDVFDKMYDVKAVTQEQMRRGEYTAENGWEVLRKPGSNTYGIVYRAMNDETFQEGAGTTVSHRNSDVLVDKGIQKPGMTNYITTDVGYSENQLRHKLVLTKQEKEQLGLVKNPADALYRSFSRIHEIRETQKIRDLLVTEEFTKNLETVQDLEAFDKELEGMDPKDIKWMIKLPSGKGSQNVVPGDITSKVNGKFKYPNIAKHYRTAERASSINGFNTNFDMVRKDVSPWLMGYKDPVLFENHPQLRRTMYAVRQLVKLAKLAMVITNPMKIAADAISNGILLTSYDVPVTKIGKYGKAISKGVKDLEKIRVDYVMAQIERNDAKAKLLKKKIAEHPYAYLVKNGMMQSMNIELMVRDSSVVTGLEADITNILDKITKDQETGKENKVGLAIQKMVESGYSLDGILKFIGTNVENINVLEDLGKNLQEAGESISRRASKNSSTYINEFLMAPGSQAVKLGSYLVQITDVIPRGILYQHLLDSGMNEKEVISTVSDAFIDYKQNMPETLKVASDYGLLMFPSFWMRIQKVIMHLLKERPATVGTAYLASQLVNLDLPTIYDANLVSKLTSEYPIIDTPPIGTMWWNV